jgi:class 3 adenylate cyclase/tetratricopeptide (TPR) repeat protein
VSFIETVQRAGELLRQQGRISLRALKLEFDLDDEQLEALLEELVDIQQVAARAGKALAWVGTAASEPEPAAATPPRREPQAEAERRQLTVLFCDLVDSTRLAAAMDPEDWRNLVREYQATAAGVVERFDGHVAQYLGDGLLVYFGWPKAHEDDAERAVRAGLGIVAAVAEGGADLSVRIGIHTGPVVVGEMGGGASRETLAMGETTNVAARLQTIAKPDAAVLSFATLRLVSGIFVTRDLGEQSLKGLAAPVRAFEALQASGVRSRLDVIAATELTPFIGRDQELMLLEDRFAQVTEGNGQAVLIQGEAGIGKSRLMQSFRERITERAHTWLECRGSAYTQDSAFYPVLELHRQGLGFRPDDPAETRLDRISDALAAVGFDPAETLPVVAALHGVPLGERFPAPNLSPESMRKKTFALMTEWLLRLGKRQPLVLLMEDLHWMDPSTLELIGRILEQVPTAPVLLLATYRPDFESPWGARSFLTPMLLSRFTRAQLADLVRKAARGHDLRDSWVEEILRRADGVPLFAEELTRTLLDQSSGPSEDGTLPIHIPETLQDSLMARLDALGPVKELAQVGSVLGREFSYDLLLKVSPLNEADLQAALRAAVREELFYQRGTPPEATYLFKHALIRDAAYQSMLRATRQRHHRRVAETLMERLPDVAEVQPDLVAHHLTEGGDDERAIEYWGKAGVAAMEKVAYEEAISHLRRGIRLAESCAPGSGAHPRELRLQLDLGRALIPARGWASEDAQRTWERARVLCTAETDPFLAAYVHHGLVGEQISRGTPRGALADARRLVEISPSARAEVRAVAAYLMGLPLLYLGRFSESVELFERAMFLYDPERDAFEGTRVGHLGAYLYGYAGLAYWHLGRPERACWAANQSMELVAQRRDPFTECFVLAWGSITATLRRDWDRSQALGARAAATAAEQSFPVLEAVGALARTRADGAKGDATAADRYAVAMMRGAATGNRAGAPLILGELAELQLLEGRASEARATLKGALELAHQTDQRFRDAELHRLEAECLLRLDGHSPNDAEALFCQALGIARSQQTKALELRAATSLARFWQRQGKQAEARNLLQPVYDWFTEGFDTQDLKDAKALLEELA